MTSEAPARSQGRAGSWGRVRSFRSLCGWSVGSRWLGLVRAGTAVQGGPEPQVMVALFQGIPAPRTSPGPAATVHTALPQRGWGLPVPLWLPQLQPAIPCGRRRGGGRGMETWQREERGVERMSSNPEKCGRVGGWEERPRGGHGEALGNDGRKEGGGAAGARAARDPRCGPYLRQAVPGLGAAAPPARAQGLPQCHHPNVTTPV